MFDLFFEMNLCLPDMASFIMFLLLKFPVFFCFRFLIIVEKSILIFCTQ